MNGPLRTAEIYFDGLLTEPRIDHPECVAVHPDGSVWCGGEAGQIYRIEGEAVEEVATTGGFCLGIAFDADANLYVCDLVHAAVMQIDGRSGAVDRFADGADGHRFQAPNFPAFDSEGRLYVSDSGTPGTPSGRLFRFAADGSGSLWHPGPFDFANGLAISAGEDALYVAETWSRRVVAVAIETSGAPGATRTVVALPGMLPDGLALDTHGRIYVGCYEPSRIVVHDPATGSTDLLAADDDAHTLCHPTNVAFLGDRLLTANLGRWHLSIVDAQTPGLSLGPFRGRASSSSDSTKRAR